MEVSSDNYHTDQHKLLFLLFLFLLPGCFSGETKEPEEEIFVESRHRGQDSLHTTSACTTPVCEGENCVTAGCHNEGSGNAVLQISGTVFQFQDLNQAYINSFAVIEFYTGPGGSGELNRSLQVDAYGNFYSTEPLSAALYPALRYEDTDGNIHRVHMPRPTVPIQPGSCNICHTLAQPELSFFNTTESPKYIRINNGISSSSTSDLTYHQTLPSDPGPDCLQSACHAEGNSNGYTVFTMAGLVIQTETQQPYDLGDAAIGLFPEECDDIREDENNNRYFPCQTGVAAEDVIPRTITPKTYVEINPRGHFYTTIPIDWSTAPTYPTLANYDAGVVCRNIQYMPHDANQQPLPDGNCYSCHNGTITAAISIRGIRDPDDPNDPTESFQLCQS